MPPRFILGVERILSLPLHSTLLQSSRRMFCVSAVIAISQGASSDVPLSSPWPRTRSTVSKSVAGPPTGMSASRSANGSRLSSKASPTCWCTLLYRSLQLRELSAGSVSTHACKRKLCVHKAVGGLQITGRLSLALRNSS